MKPGEKLWRRGARFCGSCLWSLCVWSVWLALSLLLAFQIYIACAHELALPPVVLRALETRLAASGVRADFGRTTFDPSGRLLVENARLFLPGEETPAVTAQLLYVQADPWALLAGRFDPELLRASGVSLWVPAMLSDSGGSERLVDDMDLTLTPSPGGIELHQLTARIAGLALHARGAIDIGPLRHERTAPLPLTDLLAKNYPALCRRLAGLSHYLGRLHRPVADIVFQPSGNRGAIAQITVLSDGMDADPALPVASGPLRATARVPLWGKAPFSARAEIQGESLQLPHDITLRDARATVLVRLDPTAPSLALRHMDLSVARIESQGVTVSDVSARINDTGRPHLQVVAVTRVGREPVAIDAALNARDQSGAVHARGRFDPALMTVLEHHTKHDIRRFLDFATPPEFDLNVNLAPGHRFAGLTGDVFATKVFAYHVTFDAIGGHVAFDGTHFNATAAEARIGDNFARGSFYQDLSDRRFRFLLKGRLRPPAISGWFHEWWPHFWDNFDFAAAAPDASVDVQGRWGHGWETSVFVFADCAHPVIRGESLDHATTLIYLRPHYYDAMEIFATRGAGSAQGSFVRRLEDHDFALKRMDFDFDSTLPLAVAAGLVGDGLATTIAPFQFAAPPHLKVKGCLAANARDADRPDRHLTLDCDSSGAFSFHHFPLADLAFSARIDNDAVLISPLSVGFADGAATGKISLTGPPGHERLGFDLNLQKASLQQSVAILDGYMARKNRRPLHPATDPYVDRSAHVTLDLGVSAEGDLRNPYSFTGTGNAELNGRGLGEIRLLGLLSELLNFTSLRFNNVRANFTVDQDRLVFPEVSITGSNTAIAAHGSYNLEHRNLDFNARVYPFQESKFILKSLIGAVLTPLSTVLEVKLTGKLDKPSWAFVIGPTNILRNLIQAPDKKPLSASPPPPMPPPTVTP
jgi:hypothetical protein